MIAPRSPMLRALPRTGQASSGEAILRRAVFVLFPVIILVILWQTLRARLLPTSYPWRVFYLFHDRVYLVLEGYLVTRFGILGTVGILVGLLLLTAFLLTLILGRSPLDGLHHAVIRHALSRPDYHSFLLTGEAFGRGLGLRGGLIPRAVKHERERLTLALASSVQAPRGRKDVNLLAAVLSLEWVLLKRELPNETVFRQELPHWHQALVQIRTVAESSSSVSSTDENLLKSTLVHFDELVENLAANAARAGDKEKDTISDKPVSEEIGKVDIPDAVSSEKETNEFVDLGSLSSESSADLLARVCRSMADDALASNVAIELSEHTRDVRFWLDKPNGYWERSLRLDFKDFPDAGLMDELEAIEHQNGLEHHLGLWSALAAEAAFRFKEPELFWALLERLETLQLLFDMLEIPPEPPAESEPQASQADVDDGAVEESPVPPMHPADQLYWFFAPALDLFPTRWFYLHAARLQQEQVGRLQQDWQQPEVISTGVLGVEDFAWASAPSQSYHLSGGPNRFESHRRTRPTNQEVRP